MKYCIILGDTHIFALHTYTFFMDTFSSSFTTSSKHEILALKILLDFKYFFICLHTYKPQVIQQIIIFLMNLSFPSSMYHQTAALSPIVYTGENCPLSKCVIVFNYIII